jgi:phage terminase large subunit-like protein
MKGQLQLVWGRVLKDLLRDTEKTDEELAQETEKNAIELTSVANYGFTLLTIFQKRHVFLDCVARDYEQKDGFSSANALLDELHFKYLELQQSKQLE